MQDLSCIHAVSKFIDDTVLDLQETAVKQETLSEFIKTRNQCVHIDLPNRNETIRIIYKSESDLIKKHVVDGRAFWKIGPLVIELPDSIKSVDKGGGGK